MEVVFVLAITSGSCKGRHEVSFGLLLSGVESVTVLGYWDIPLELGVDSELLESAEDDEHFSLSLMEVDTKIQK